MKDVVGERDGLREFNRFGMDATPFAGSARAFRRGNPAAIGPGRRVQAIAWAGEPKLDLLKGVTVGNLFFEPSTRTRTSFSLAAKRLSADTVDFSSSRKQPFQGGNLRRHRPDIEAMGVTQMVVRHSSSGAPHLLATHLAAGIVNAGDGTHEHPTQGLLDLMTIREHRGGFQGLTVALVGGHSAQPRCPIEHLGADKAGGEGRRLRPATLIPPYIEQLGVRVSYDLDEIVGEVDVINLLRIQAERQRSAFFPSIYEYAHFFGMNGDRIRRARHDVLILAPGAHQSWRRIDARSGRRAAQRDSRSGHQRVVRSHGQSVSAPSRQPAWGAFAAR
jgi:aspartate carbamoyltransferase catalytic subunit